MKLLMCKYPVQIYLVGLCLQIFVLMNWAISRETLSEMTVLISFVWGNLYTTGFFVVYGLIRHSVLRTLLKQMKVKE